MRMRPSHACTPRETLHPTPYTLQDEAQPCLYTTPDGLPPPGYQEGSLAITNSFGMPSMPPDYLRQDVGAAVAGLAPGQPIQP